MNELSIKQMTISSIEVAEMLGVEHYKIIRKLEGAKERKGYIQVLADAQMGVSDYFIEDSYKDNSGKTNKCYQFTKLGCDFIANKFTGEKGIIFTAKYVKRFNEMTKYIKEQSSNKTQFQVPFDEVIKAVSVIAGDLKVNEASKLLMYEKTCNSYGVATEFLPKYENNGSREIRPATELLKRIGASIKTAAFNQLLIKNGLLEERTRKSTKSDELRYFKALTEKGLQYGENLISPKNQRETQPYYFADSFEELYSLVAEKGGVLA